jgi:hypothetical protein
MANSMANSLIRWLSLTLTSDNSGSSVGEDGCWARRAGPDHWGDTVNVMCASTQGCPAGSRIRAIRALGAWNVKVVGS